MYTIGQVSAMFGLPVSTLRYYDKEGLFPALGRASGIRRFSETELEALRVIECLKKSGMEIKDIRQFMEWCAQGSQTYPLRLELFVRQKAAVEQDLVRHGEVESRARTGVYPHVFDRDGAGRHVDAGADAQDVLLIPLRPDGSRRQQDEQDECVSFHGGR